MTRDDREFRRAIDIMVLCKIWAQEKNISYSAAKGYLLTLNDRQLDNLITQKKQEYKA